MATIIGVSGSLRAKSFNTALLRAAAGVMPTGAVLDVRTLHGIPPYNGDDEAAHGVPAVVADLKEAIARADGLILATPEYNNSIPGVLKNAIDWLSRPPADMKRVFGGRPTMIVGASAGGFGTVLAQAAWLPVLRTLGTVGWNGGRLLIPRARDVFDAEGGIVDDEVLTKLQALVAGFVEFAAATSRDRG